MKVRRLLVLIGTVWLAMTDMTNQFCPAMPAVK
jgi:hypothetical protein